MFQLGTPYWSLISSLLHLVGLRPRVYYTVTNFRGGGLNTPMIVAHYDLNIQRFTSGEQLLNFRNNMLAFL